MPEHHYAADEDPKMSQTSRGPTSQTQDTTRTASKTVRVRFDEKFAALADKMAGAALREVPELESIVIVADFGRIEGQILTGVWKVQDDEKTPSRLHGAVKSLSNMIGLLLDKALAGMKGAVDK